MTPRSASALSGHMQGENALKPIRTPHVYVPAIPQILGYDLNAEIFLKDESQQLGRSVKGRVAYAMARRSRQSGRQIVESSSGNLALGLGYWCAQLGAARPVCLVDECCEAPMIEVLSSAGCIIEMVALTEQEREEQSGVFKRIALAEEYARKGYYWPNQYDRGDWVKVHEQTTGPEIWQDGTGYDLVVGAVGTGATMSGVALSKPAGSTTRLVAVEPQGSTIFSEHAGAYRVAGAGNPFTPANYRRGLMDIELTVEDEASFSAARLLRDHGLAVGSSGSMAIVGALRAMEQLAGEVRRTLVIVADDGWYETI
jgi:cysteine synthase